MKWFGINRKEAWLIGRKEEVRVWLKVEAKIFKMPAREALIKTKFPSQPTLLCE